MADEFASSVHFGLKLSKRIYYGKSASLSAPKPAVMEKSPSTVEKSPSMMKKSPSIMEKSRSMLESYLPTAPMVYAVITEPMIVDNPEVPSYQPYVHGMREPPALIPLHTHGIKMEVDCYLDTAFVEVSGTWRLHCVAAGRSCDCRIAIPMGEQITMSAVREWAASQGSKLSEAVAVNNLGKWKTATQMISLTILLATRDSSFTEAGFLVALGTALLYISAGLAVWSLVVYMRKIWKVLLM